MSERGKSKFAGVLSAARQREPEPEVPDAREAAAAAPQASAGASAGPGRIGRPKTGKRSDPAYEQVSVYVRKDTHRDTLIRLLQEGGGQDFSELVESLLADWLKG